MESQSGRSGAWFDVLQLEGRLTPSLQYHTPIFPVGSQPTATIDQANTTTIIAAFETQGSILAMPWPMCWRASRV